MPYFFRFTTNGEKNDTMSTINLGDGNCPECHNGPIRFGIPVYGRPPRKGGEGGDTEVWCLECARKLLHGSDSGK
jgi:hypothetical protein